MDTAIDFLPDRLRERRVRARQFCRQAGLLALAGALLAVWIYCSQRNVAQAQAELETLKTRSGNLRQVLAQREDLQKQQADLLLKEQISDRLGSRAGALDVLSELERLLPPGVSLTSLNLDGVQLTLGAEMVRDRGGARLPGLPPRQSTVNRLQLVLTGIAPADVDVAALIGQMTASPLFEDVNMGYIRGQVVQGRRAREFQVSCHVAR